jgi:riboflavin synthase
VFTGIVVEVGRLSAAPRPAPSGGVELRIAHSEALGARLAVGASLAVAGVCLTVVERAARESRVELSAETLARTRLGRLAAGDAVNLEPALAAGEPLGGHWVQGHVDGLVALLGRRDQGAGARFTVELPPAFDAFVVEKGSVALDGVSLTVARRDPASFDAALVPHTLAVTTLGAARPGARFHFEADILAKYVERAVAARLGAPPPPERR